MTHIGHNNDSYCQSLLTHKIKSKEEKLVTKIAGIMQKENTFIHRNLV